MSDEPPTLFNTLIDYDQNANVGISTVGDHQIMNQITELNFEIDKTPIGSLLTGWEFAVPEYQRLFSWKEKQHRQIWSEIQEFVDAELRAGQDNVSDVFFGSMYFAVNEDDSRLEVIDGQQRLTSIYLLLRTVLEELTALRETDAIADRHVRNLCKNTISQIETILYQWDSFEGRTATLTLNKHDDEFFDALICGDDAQLNYLLSPDREYIDGRRGEATQIADLVDEFDINEGLVEAADPEDAVLSKYVPVYESNQRLLDAYNFYSDRVTDLTAQRDDADSKALALVNLNNYLQRSYYIGQFQIREAEPDFRMQIFEILNDRGLELTKIDRIRANVVNAFFDEADRDDYVGKWEAIVVAFRTDSSKIEDYLSVYLSIIEDSVSSTGEASSQLLNAFSTRNIESDVNPRFDDLSEARTFLDRAEELVTYYQDLTNPKLEKNELELSPASRSRCQEVLVRLDSLGTSQWHPLILAAYHYTVTDPNGDEESFYRLLETVEKLNIRRLLIGGNPNVFQNVFVEGAHEFYKSDDGGENPYEHTRRFLVDQVQENTAQLFSDGFIDLITHAQSWNTTAAKLLLGKIANQRFREAGTTIDRELNMESIHLEHVLPRNLVHDPENPVWLTQFFEVADEETEIVTEVEEYIELVRLDETDLSEEDQQRKNDIETFLKQQFIEDIGNYLLLRARCSDKV